MKKTMLWTNNWFSVALAWLMMLFQLEFVFGATMSPPMRDASAAPASGPV